MSVIDAFGCLRSLRAHWHLMGSAGYGAAWLKSQSADRMDRMLQNRRRHPFPPSGVAPLGSSFRPPVSFAVIRYAAWNTVPCLSIACMMMASRRASAIRALRMVERLAIANAQSFSFRAPL